MAIFSRFRYTHPDTDYQYVGEAQIECQTFNEDYEGGANAHAVQIWSCWEFGISVEDVAPGDLSPELIKALEETALHQYLNPPATPIELPSDWDEIEVIDQKTTYTVKIKAILPDVRTDAEANIYGLSTVRRITGNPDGSYNVTANGDFHSIRGELAKVRIF